MKKNLMLTLSVVIFSCALADKPTSEISIDLQLDHIDFVVGERVRGIVNVVNSSPDFVVIPAKEICVNDNKSGDRCFIEVYRASDHGQLSRIKGDTGKFVADFLLKPGEGQKLETYLDSHFSLRSPDRYLVRPVLVHSGIRYEGQMRAFDIVPGVRVGSAMQVFANRNGRQRMFDLVTLNREQQPHLFLYAYEVDAKSPNNDEDSWWMSGDPKWRTTDLGAMMRITKPTIAVKPDGRVIVLHRVDPDHFIRSEFLSVSDDIVFNNRMLIQDPETAGTARVRAMYMESGGVTPKENPWYKFW